MVEFIVSGIERRVKWSQRTPKKKRTEEDIDTRVLQQTCGIIDSNDAKKKKNEQFICQKKQNIFHV